MTLDKKNDSLHGPAMDTTEKPKRTRVKKKTVVERKPRAPRPPKPTSEAAFTKTELALLEATAEASSVTQIVERTGMHRVYAYKLLKGLIERGLIERTDATPVYRAKVRLTLAPN
jgi:DNA-binding MarR family transcriptional regulator